MLLPLLHRRGSVSRRRFVLPAAAAAAVLFVSAVSAARAAQSTPTTPTAQWPVVQAPFAAAPDLIGLPLHSGTITPGRLLPYTPQPGDGVKNEDNGTLLTRGGVPIGYLIGPRHDFVTTFEGFSGEPLRDAEADNPANYTIHSPDDPAFAGTVTPLSVARKAKPDDWQQPKRPGLTVQHLVYLRLPKPLTPGRTYIVTIAARVNVQKPVVTFVFDPARVRSESVHGCQIGFRPDDPVKCAFLSLWTGTGGGYTFAPNLPFRLVDDTTARTVWTGRAGTVWPAHKPEQGSGSPAPQRNFNGTDVTPLDFSGFRTPGRYRVVVDGVGCSYPFTIGADVWEKAFAVQMKGFLNQRSGVPLGPPYTDFVRPDPDFRLPGDGHSVSITQSTYSILDGGDPQKGLEKGDTGQSVPEAWGGYHDAGDWNPRRITHLRTTTFWQLELLTLFPAYFRSLRLHLPPDASAAPPLPDLLRECLFELDLFRRLQRPEGGVPFGIETNGDPRDGEVSWHQSMKAFVYAPDVQSSYGYAGVAARAAQVLESLGSPQAAVYRESALRAMRWAEADRQKRQAAGTGAALPADVTEDRSLAAVCLYALTHDGHWNTVFRDDTPLLKSPAGPFYGSLLRRDAAFTYARLPAGWGDPALKEAARRALIADADGARVYQQNNAWGIAADDPGKPQFLGFYSTPHGAVSLLRAYTLTHDAAYLGSAVRACLFGGGANPNNLVYTSGVGANPVRHPLHLDSRLTGQPAPVGLTVYGNVDLAKWGDQTWITWPITYYLGAVSKPSPKEWPTTEAYFDVFFMPALNEFTMDQTMGPNAYVWGYLAARRPL